jgi:hypothetical protein
MKAMIPFLAAVLPALTAAHSQSSKTSAALPSIAVPITTAVLVIQTPREGVTFEQVMDVIPAEMRATVTLYLDGKIREWYSRGDGKGVVFLMDAKSEDEARAIVESLPLAKEKLMNTQYIPVGPLMPLRALMGPAMQRSAGQ